MMKGMRMFRVLRLLGIIVFPLLCSVDVYADYVSVTRNARIMELPDSRSALIRKAAEGDTFALISTEKIERYYAILLDETNDVGWIHDTRVDVVSGTMPADTEQGYIGTECIKHLQYGIPHPSNKVLCHDGYASGYNYSNKIPDWVSYKITKSSVNGVNVKRGSFRVDKAIPKKYRSSNTDYSKSGYDRGHLAPSASIDYSREANDQTFLYSNMAPQLAAFNRDMMGYKGVWGRLEEFERSWVKSRDLLFIIAGSVTSADSKTIGRGVVIPDQYFKIMFDPQGLESIAFLMPQDKDTGDEWTRYIVSIDDIEQATDWDFLATLDEDIQASIESVIAKPEDWDHLAKRSERWCEKLPSLSWGEMTLSELTYTCIPKGWEAFFRQESVRDEVQKISGVLEQELRSGNKTLSPAIGNVFRALYAVKPEDAKALIMGQDPAPQPGLATGLSFSLPPETPTSDVASVQRVYLEAQNEKICNDLDNADASAWTHEGVLLLNMALTIPCDLDGKCYSGIAKHVPLWSDFTQLLMTYIDLQEQPMAFILWGSKARAYASTISNTSHKAFQGGHPSPKANGAAFFCKSYFSCSNDWLTEKGIKKIDWSLSSDTCETRQPCIYEWDSRTRTSKCKTPCVPVACSNEG